jgi:hypothetical protein
MKNLGMSLVFISLMFAASNVGAASNYQYCVDSSGEVVVENGNVTILGGIGDVGQAVNQVIVSEVSERHETCVEGPNYFSEFVTLEKVTYDIEEGVRVTTEVTCTETLTGIVGPDTVCE